MVYCGSIVQVWIKAYCCSVTSDWCCFLSLGHGFIVPPLPRLLLPYEKFLLNEQKRLYGDTKLSLAKPKREMDPAALNSIMQVGTWGLFCSYFIVCLLKIKQ